VCREQDKTNEYMKNGAAMARKPGDVDRRTPPEQGEEPTSAEVVTAALAT
jgi:hypothetical protein